MVTKIFFLLTILISSSSCASENKKDVREIKWKKVFAYNFSMEVSYPSDWELIEEDDLKTTWALNFVGPKGCYKMKKRCGQISIGVSRKATRELSLIKTFYIRDIQRNKSELSLLGIKETIFSGEKAFILTTRKKERKKGGRFDVSRTTYLLDNKKDFYKIGVSESFYDNAVIKTPNDWELTKTYDRILSSIKFIPAK